MAPFCATAYLIAPLSPAMFESRALLLNNRRERDAHTSVLQDGRQRDFAPGVAVLGGVLLPWALCIALSVDTIEPFYLVRHQARCPTLACN